jgi:hypothetical protein
MVSCEKVKKIRKKGRWINVVRAGDGQEALRRRKRNVE